MNVDDIERVDGGETFRWRGHYEVDMNLAHTDETELGVFADFEPKLSQASSEADVLFLGNIQPDLQRRVRTQCTPRLAALDSMNLWIETTRDSLLAAIGEVDCVLLNDSEIRMLTEEPNLARAARKVMDLGPADRGREARRVRGGHVHLRRVLRASRVPPRGRARPHRSGRQLRRRLPRLSRHAGDRSHRKQPYAEPIAYGTVLASFNVEQFGIERMASLTEGEISERYDALRAMTHFELPA